MFYSASEAMISLIRYEVCDGPLPEKTKECLTPDFISEIYEIAKRHDLSHVIASAILPLDLPLDEALKQKLQRAQMTAVYRYAQMRHELERVSCAFEAGKIPFIPLKGAVLRQYYKRPEMRTSCDIDIFVGEENLERAVKLLTEELSYDFDARTTHDVELYSKSKIHVELHFDLIENDEKVATVLKNVWELSHLSSGECRHLMNDELFVAYHVAHMAKHFFGGGCGVRAFLDLWIINHKMAYDKDKAKNLISEMGLLKFFEEASHLSEVWFSDASHTELTKEIEEYIVGAGVYGSAENRMAVMRVTKGGGKFKYAMSRIFLPHEKLKKIYPKLEKHPILLPFYEVKRWFRYLLRHSASRGYSELSIYGSVSEEKQRRALLLCQKLKIDS